MEEPTRHEIDTSVGAMLIEFGAASCGYCQAAQGNIATVVQRHPAMRHVKVEDGRGRLLGRSFGVKLWPTLVYLDNGAEKGQVVRPQDVVAIESIIDGAKT